MLKSVIYSNKITVWWKRETFEKINYEIYVNDKFLGGTSATFYTIKNLKPNTRIIQERQGGTVFRERVKTKQKRLNLL